MSCPREWHGALCPEDGPGPDEVDVQLLDLSAALVFLIGALAYLNVRFLKLPSTIGATIGG